MNELLERLDLHKETLKGRIATEEEIKVLIGKFSVVEDLDEIINIIGKYKLIGQEFEVSNEIDHSGMGIDMEWLSPAGQITEAFDAYPGMIVVKQGYLPVGDCLQGSGDPYFLRKQEGQWNLYRILHDAAKDMQYTPNMVEFVLSLEELIGSLET